jgi:hypothetical protein
MGRPAPIGANAAEDRFEVLWHQIALAILQGSRSWNVHDDYLAQIGPRIARMAQVKPPVANRFPLMRAYNAMMKCCQTLISPMPAPTFFSMRTARAAPRGPVVTPNEALAMYDEAAGFASIRIEALVRGAYFEMLLGRGPRALARLDRAALISDDMLAYAASIIRAGVFDKLGQPGDAAESYRTASQLSPVTQAPLVGLAAALLRDGRTDDAVAAASKARSMPGDGPDPWRIFMQADGRFISPWLLELRTLLR